MTRQRWMGWTVAGVMALATAGWLYAQDGGQRPPQDGQGPGGGQGPGRGQMFRAMMMQAQMAATADYVFILRGNTLYKYDVKELKLQGKVEVEMPAMQRPAQEGGQPPPPPQQ